ncbi:hypothetical protein [Adhaeribacter pallidiroseus]|uniref:hypothetical protein n=1 Tax=Adhaeribacter pallidiroseus TaxID=2072847 RepID=UPI001313EF1A|nr:hypothetical protein [Adhaeribacter pallidiroseus]
MRKTVAEQKQQQFGSGGPSGFCEPLVPVHSIAWWSEERKKEVTTSSPPLFLGEVP